MAFDLPADAQQVEEFSLGEVLAAVRVEAVADLARCLINWERWPELAADDLGAAGGADDFLSAADPGASMRFGPRTERPRVARRLRASCSLVDDLI